MFGRLLEKRRKKRAVNLYLTKLRPKLGRLFGKADYYTPEQIEEAVVAAELPLEYIHIGTAIYSSSGAFRAYHDAAGDGADYWRVREEIARLFFHGNDSFTQSNVAEYAKSKQGDRPVIEGDSWDGKEPPSPFGGLDGDDMIGSNYNAADVGGGFVGH